MVFGYEYQGELVIDATWNALWGAMTSVGMIFGGVICGQLSDLWGRKVSMFLGAALSMVGVGVEYAAANVGVLLAGKIVSFPLFIHARVCSPV
jgi:MFS family permease